MSRNFKDILEKHGMTKEIKEDPAKVDPMKVDPNKVDPTKVDPAKVEPAKVDPTKVDPNKKENPTPNQFDWNTVNQEVIFSHLTEKAGREIKSYDDLKAQTVEREVEKIVPQELAPEVEAFNKYHSETGRDFNDFMRIQQDWNNVGEDVKLRAYLAEQHPDLSSDDINFLYEDTYGIPAKLEGEEGDYTAQELSANANAIRKAEIFRKQDAAKATKFFEDNKQKYLTPMEQRKADLESQIAAGREAWTTSVGSAMESVTSIDHDGFSYDFKGKDEFGKSAKSIEGLMGRYKNEKGELDHTRLLKTLMMGEQFADILNDHKNFVEASVIEGQLRDKSNPSHLKTDPDKVKNLGEKQFDAKQHLLDTIHKNHGGVRKTT